MSENEKKEYMGLDYEATVSEEGIPHVPRSRNGTMPES